MATTNNSYIDHQHKMLHQQQQLTTIGTDNDEAATNCSETMSTANEEDECFGQPQTINGSSQNTQANSCSSHQRRLADPPEVVASEQLPVGHSDIQQSDNIGNNVAQQGPAAAEIEEESSAEPDLTSASPQETDGGCPSELSLASGATQAPPSYGTATRVCATLDARQLYDSLGQSQVQQSQQQDTASNVFRFTSSASQQYNLSLLANQQQQQPPLAVNNYSNAGSLQTHEPLFNNRTIESYNPSLQALTMRVPRTQSFETQSFATRSVNNIGLQSHRQQMNDSQQHLSASGSLPRLSFMVPHLNSSGSNIDGCSATATTAAAATLSGGQHLNDPKLDNNQATEFGWHTLQQQQVATFKLAPINHVISGQRSIQWQPQTNQYYVPGSVAAAAAGAATLDRQQQQQQCQVEHPAQLVGSSRKSARIMDAPFAWPAAAALFDQQQQQQSTVSANRNDGPSVRWLGPAASISGPAAPATTTNVAVGLARHRPQEPPDDQGARKNNRPHTFGASNQQSINNIHNSASTMRPLSDKGSPSRRSDENFDRHQQQQQQAHRKRRRHRSTSGRSVSPETGVEQALAGRESSPGLLPNTQLSAQCGPTDVSQQQQQQRASKKPKGGNHKQTISAHCWLIDSSDDQTYGVNCDSRKYHSVGASSTKPTSGAQDGESSLPKVVPQTHLTVAMMKQTIEQQRLRQQVFCSDSPQGTQCLKSDLCPSSSSLAAQHQQQKVLSKSSCAVSEDADLTGSLRTNSLRMERILNRNDSVQNHSKHTSAASCRRATRTLPARRQQQKHNQLQRRRPSTSPSSSSSGSSLSGQCNSAANQSASNNRGGTTARLSILLSLMANLVRRRPRGRQPVAPATGGPALHDDDNYYPMAPTNSISGSVLPSRGVQSLAPYTTCGSLVISSSSSTSAYATESSHLSSANSQLSRAGYLLNATAVTERPMSMALLKGGQHHSHMPPSSASTAGSSLFYSSSGNSGIQTSTGGSHSYEYCDDERINETKFVQQPINEEQTADFTSSSSQSHDSKLDDEQDSPKLRTINTQDRICGKTPHQAILSDNELLSAGSESGFHATRNGCQLSEATAMTTASLAAVVSHATPSMARRRWWWISFTNTLCRRPCSHKLTGSATDSEEGALAEPVQRYKSLRSRRQSSSSTLKNVLSLAKADRVFRTRLLASLLVSCILLGLIGLLCGLIYSRSTLLSQRSRLGLDQDLDYDLSWLWPYDSPLSHLNQAMPNTRYRNIDPQLVKTPTELLFMDSTLRDPLQMIEQSERLAQYQQTLSHLTNLQLANDNFIDLTQLVNRLAAPTSSEPDLSSSTTSIPSNVSTSSSAKRQPDNLQLSDVDRDLISLTLLSNLHWPLVKWRHQNQQSVANFLSFSLPSFAGSVPSNLKSLLSILLLTEAGSELPIAVNNNSNLAQFAHFGSLLRSSSYNIVSCSHQFNTLMAAKSSSSRLSLRLRFCDQLITRYRRMMFTLSQLNHSHLIKLRDSTAEPASSTIDTLTTNGAGSSFNQQQHQAQIVSSRTLISFFLDRLALLDVQLLAESTLASINLDEKEFEESFGAVDDEEILTSSGANSWEGRALAVILNASPTDATLKSPSSKWLQSSSLIDLAKLVVGDGSARLNLDFDHSDWALHLQRLETENNEAWRELLSQDLLYPWSSHRLPHFSVPQSYDLFFHPNLTTRLVLGMVKIGFRLERPTRFIVLHCANLNLLDVSLWLKQEPQTVNRSIDDGLRPEVLHRIPIRRILRNVKLEQIYIELDGQINPLRTESLRSASRSLVAGSLNFGGELPLQEVARKPDSLFILSISYNKTSLMQKSNHHASVQQPSDESSIVPDTGLEFVQYSDYFAQSDAELKTMLYTQFEPQNSRRFFPSFDEPHLKAKFQLNLVHNQAHQVLFNAPKREKVPYSADGALQMSVFEPTSIPISTYLVAFVVCDTQNIKSLTSRVAQLQTTSGYGNTKSETKHIQVQVLAQFEQLGQAEFASQLVPQLLTFYQSHLNFPYPFEKLDLVAIPKPVPRFGVVGQAANQQLLPISSQQRLNTMENMGLIWFKANLLLIDTNLISQNLIEQVAMIISHQLAHQYFGNIVSISRWGDLWLYESLCQYLESVALSNVQPDWRLDEQFVVTSIQDTLASEQFDWLPDSWSAPSIGTNGEQLVRDDSDDAELDAADSLSSGQFESELGAASSDQTDLIERFPFFASGSARGATELRRGSALLHMLLFNLLPSQEARGRLLRRCLSLYRYGTMSRAQFWRQFGEQLAQDGSSERLALATDLLSRSSALPEQASTNDQLSYQGDKWLSNFTTQHHQLEAAGTPSERVVFVRPASGRRAQVSNEALSGDAHRIHVRSADQLSQNLELMMSAWLERRGYPLITASINRDRIQLKQERFSFVWWNEPELVESESIVGSPKALVSADASTIDRMKRMTQEPMGDDPVWPIPLMLVSRVNQKQAKFLWLDKRELEIPLHELAYSSPSMEEFSVTQSVDLRKGHSNVWFKLNVNQSSLVRVNYDERNWETLTDLMLKSHYSNHVLSPLDRANLIDDALTLMRCGKLSVGVAMNLTLYLEVGEREFMPWTSALRHLDQMQTLLNQNPLWHRYVLKLMQPISSVIGWKDDGPHLMRKLRRSLFSVALQYGDERTVNKAKQEFKGWFKNGRFIVPNLQELVYVAGIRYGDQQEWFYCWQKYAQLVGLDMGSAGQNQTENGALDGSDGLQRDHGKSNPLLVGVTAPIGSMLEPNEPNTENEKRQLLTALASTHNTWLLEQFLNYSLDSTKIQPHHLKHVMQTLGKNPVARLYLWRFVRLNWNSLVDRYFENSLDYQNSSRNSDYDRLKSVRDNEHNQVLATMIMESTKHFVTKLDYDEVKTFFEIKRKQHKQRSDVKSWSLNLERAIQQSLQVIRANIFWRNHIEPKLTKWLAHYDSTIIS